MSPEMLGREGHDRLVDVYGLGLLLYEMVIGIPPFYSPNFDEIFNSVLTEKVRFPSKVSLSAEIKSLITKILMKKPEDRLGFINDVQDILNHPWCKKLSIDDIYNKRTKSPFTPDFFKLYFEPTKDIDEIKFFKELQFEKNEEALNEIFDSEENERELNGFAYEKPKNIFLKKTFIKKAHFTIKSNDFSIESQGLHKIAGHRKQPKNNHSTGQLFNEKSVAAQSHTTKSSVSPFIMFPTNVKLLTPQIKT